MIEFKNEEEIREWVTLLENNLTLMKAQILCEKRQCAIVKESTSGFVYRGNAINSAVNVKNCADMVLSYLKKGRYDDEGGKV